MKIEIDIPKEFEEHFMLDKFEDSLHRLSADAHLIAGNYEQETAIMLIKAFKESKTAYDVDKVVKQLKNEKQTSASARAEAIIGMCGASANHYGGEECAYEKAIKIAKAGGANE